MKRKSSWITGDIIQVALPREFRYLQLVGRDADNIPVLRVLAHAATEPVTNTALLSTSPTLYWIQSFCEVLVEDSRFKYIGNAAGAGALPTLRRRFVKGWFLIGDGVERFVACPLPDEVADISLKEGLPPQVIVDRMIADWRPSDDRGDFGELMRQLRDRRQQALAIEQDRETIFFLDFPSDDAARAAEKALRDRGFSVECEPGRQSVTVKRQWGSGDSLDSMDLLELDLLSITRPFSGTISGRETSV